MKVLDWIAIILLVIGGLNWGLVGAANFDLVDYLFGTESIIATVIYCLVGLSAIYYIIFCRDIHRRCCGYDHSYVGDRSSDNRGITAGERYPENRPTNDRPLGDRPLGDRPLGDRPENRPGEPR